MPVLLMANNLQKSFMGVHAVVDVSVSITKGEIVSIIGPNGAGKTTLLNLLSGVIRPDQGAVHFEGDDITRLRPHRYAGLGITRTFQNLALFKAGTVLDNIRIGFHSHVRSGIIRSALYLPSVGREEALLREQSEEIARFLEIEHLLNLTVGTLSYGLQKRVELARALAGKPKLLLLDELVSGMNREEKQDIARFIFQIRRKFNCGIVMIEHDLEFVIDISDRIYVLNFGRQIADGTPSEVVRNPEVVSAYVGESQQQADTLGAR